MHLKSFVGLRYPNHIDSISTHMSVYEKQALYELSKSLPAGSNCVEIGSYLGASSCCIAAGFRGGDNKLHCVDTWWNDNVSVARQNTFQVFLDNTSKYKSFIVTHRGWSKDVAKDFNIDVDFLFIDGDHSWSGIVTDLKSWLPLLKKHGILVMHDVGWGDCKRALEELILPIE